MCYRCAQSVAELISSMGARRNSWPGESFIHETGNYMTHYNKLAIDRPEDLLFGTAPHPVSTRMGMKIGGGLVYPELNFTLPSIEIKKENWPEIRNHYEQIVSSALLRAVELECPGVVVEFETLPPMTEHPEWGLEIAGILLAGMEKERSAHGLKSVLRMTPNDNREFVRPPQLRSGYHLDRMLQLFETSAAAGAEFLSIESVGGKELHDQALVECDIAQVIFALCILGARDMEFLWSKLHEIALRHRVYCAGDTACGFGNTAMVLAEQKVIPRVFATVVRAVTAVRSLVAYECGAVGPGKDCGYENVILKAITGCPMAMEGKAAACAHLSSMGNLAAAACDTWSNESVQNIRLLSAMAPTVSMEQLIYDCRLMNQASSEGKAAALTLQRWMIDSDAALDPQAFILTPENSIALAKAIVGADSRYHAGKAVALEAVRLMKEAQKAGKLKIVPRELPWLDRIEGTVSDLPQDEDEFISDMMEVADASKYHPAEYGLKT
jgi:methanol--5-hydroxybenzimidazolylcobamide Co-methyltransferase